MVLYFLIFIDLIVLFFIMVFIKFFMFFEVESYMKKVYEMIFDYINKNFELEKLIVRVYRK